jgi:hypothetical protein
MAAARRRGGFCPRPLVNAVALLALLFQILLVQTHVDGLARLGAPHNAEIVAVAKPDVAIGAGSVGELACPVCAAQATSSVALLSVGLSLAAAALVFVAELAIELQRGPVTQAHPWQSRAPPAHL